MTVPRASTIAASSVATPSNSSCAVTQRGGTEHLRRLYGHQSSPIQRPFHDSGLPDLFHRVTKRNNRHHAVDPGLMQQREHLLHQTLSSPAAGRHHERLRTRHRWEPQPTPWRPNPGDGLHQRYHQVPVRLSRLLLLPLPGGHRAPIARVPVRRVPCSCLAPPNRSPVPAATTIPHMLIG